MEHYAAIAARARTGPAPAAVFAAARQSQQVARDAQALRQGRRRPAPTRWRRRSPIRGGENGEGDATASASTCATWRRCSRCRWASASRPSTRRASSTPTTTRTPTLVRDLAQLSAGPERLPGRPRGARRRRPRADAGVDRVRPPPAGELLRRDRSRRRRHRLGHGCPRARRDAVRLSRPQHLRPRRQPQGHHRLPRACTRACSSSGWAPAPTRCCPTPAAWGAWRSPGTAALMRRPGVGRRRARATPARHAGRAGHARVPLQRLSLGRARRARALQHDELRRGRPQPALGRPGGYRSRVSRDVEPARARRPALHGPPADARAPTGSCASSPGTPPRA